MLAQAKASLDKQLESLFKNLFLHFHFSQNLQDQTPKGYSFTISFLFNSFPFCIPMLCYLCHSMYSSSNEQVFKPSAMNVKTSWRESASDSKLISPSKSSMQFMNLDVQARLNKFVPFLKANISNNKAWNPIKFGVKWKLWFSSFWECPWIWDLDLNCPRYARSYDRNFDCKISQNDSLLIQDV